MVVLLVQLTKVYMFESYPWKTKLLAMVLISTNLKLLRLKFLQFEVIFNNFIC
jgi:hypothetical protein